MKLSKVLFAVSMSATGVLFLIPDEIKPLVLIGVVISIFLGSIQLVKKPAEKARISRV